MFSPKQREFSQDVSGNTGGWLQRWRCRPGQPGPRGTSQQLCTILWDKKTERADVKHNTSMTFGFPFRKRGRDTATLLRQQHALFGGHLADGV